jgi:Xaa-Pro aminopeptidase
MPAEAPVIRTVVTGASCYPNPPAGPAAPVRPYYHRRVFDFAARRRRFLEALGEGLAIIPAARIRYRSRDVEYLFRQDSDFFYLTGFLEPDAVAIFRPGRSPDYALFVRPRDRVREAWDGERAGLRRAVSRHGAGAAFSVGTLSERLRPWLREAETVYVRLGADPRVDAAVIAAAGRPEGPPALVDPGRLLYPMRLRKEPAEIAAMRRAASISVQAHAAAAAAIAPGRFEYEIQARLESGFRERGASGPAYPSIVASGPNATTLHYTGNGRRIGAGDLVLIDAGAEVDLYASDVTRTYPASGQFRPPQRETYALVLEAQKAAIARCVPGVPATAPHETAREVLRRGLARLKIVPKSADIAPFALHRTSHWLGLDVHDVGAFGTVETPVILEPGMVLTVEPGLYFRAGAGGPSRFRGIGVRIEDDVLVTAKAPEVLSGNLPREIEEVEAAVGARGKDRFTRNGQRRAPVGRNGRRRGDGSRF